MSLQHSGQHRFGYLTVTLELQFLSGHWARTRSSVTPDVNCSFVMIRINPTLIL